MGDYFLLVLCFNIIIGLILIPFWIDVFKNGIRKRK